MTDVANLQDHMAYSCQCGCVDFNLLKSGNIECAFCGEKISDSTWGLEVTSNQKPVAWRWGVPQLKNGKYEWRYSVNQTRPDAIPLYTRPQPAASHELLCVCGCTWEIKSDGSEELISSTKQPADELLRLRDLLGKANALARIRANEIKSLKASLYGLYELEKQRDELQERLIKTEGQLGEAVWNYGELKREQLANQQKTSGSPIDSLTEPADVPVAWRTPNWGHGPEEWAYFDADERPTGASGPTGEPLYTRPHSADEPVGQLQEDAFGRGQVMWFNKPADQSMLYIRPAERKFEETSHQPASHVNETPKNEHEPAAWVGLTDDDLDYLCHLAYTGDEEFALTVEAKLKEKNT